MATTDKRLCAGALTNSNATLYTAPSSVGAITIIKAITLCNISANTVTVTLKFHGIAVLNQYAILASDTITIPFVDQIIEASEIIEGLASSVSSMNYYISGKEVV